MSGALASIGATDHAMERITERFALAPTVSELTKAVFAMHHKQSLVFEYLKNGYEKHVLLFCGTIVKAIYSRGTRTIITFEYPKSWEVKAAILELRRRREI